MKKTFSKTSILDALQLLTSAWSEVSETTIKNCLIKVGIPGELAEEVIIDEDNLFKDLAAEKAEETINEFRERLPDEVTEELNAAVLLDINAKLSTNGEKPSDAKIFAEVRGEAIQEEDDIDVVYDEPPTPLSAFEVEKVTEVFQQFTLSCNEGDDLRDVVSKVNIYSQRAIAKRKK